jgi:hypothetical protein
MRNRYWSNGKFANWVRGTPQPECGTSKEWRDWKQTAKTKHPFRYWLAETALDKIQDFIMYPIDKLYSVKYWLVNRFVTKTHQLTSNLKKGEWHELDERILHCLFDELVNFVEVEVAWKNIICDEASAVKYNAPWHSKGWFKSRTWRNAQSGLDYLDWETTLIKDESWGLSKDDPEYGQPTEQSLKAQEISELYHWWKFTRPNRPDPYEVSGWNARYETKTNSGDSLWDYMCTPETEEEKLETRRVHDLMNKIEEDYFQEDEEMLIKLIRLRRSLWT